MERRAPPERSSQLLRAIRRDRSCSGRQSRIRRQLRHHSPSVGYSGYRFRPHGPISRLLQRRKFNRAARTECSRNGHHQSRRQRSNKPLRGNERGGAVCNRSDCVVVVSFSERESYCGETGDYSTNWYQTNQRGSAVNECIGCLSSDAIDYARK